MYTEGLFERKKNIRFVGRLEMQKKRKYRYRGFQSGHRYFLKQQALKKEAC